MKRFFKYLQHFDFITSFILYITHKIKSSKFVSFKYQGTKVYLRPGKSDYKVLTQVFVDNQYESGEYISDPKIIVDGGANIG
ncbi:MAG TPA: hypothetical protein VL947_04630, partial [Cytophagales bacterium]|nr:hypothetical protein [Cytophagales bacterium]